ncbi:MAG: hypothetical protein E6J30_12225 [Chloroflexi bacterium]|nr:MAG: hypothetical protein E6J30_12225 [Chloroflexota bacterium]
MDRAIQISRGRDINADAIERAHIFEAVDRSETWVAGAEIELLIGYRLRRVPASRISPANTLDQITTQFSGEVVRRRRRAIAEDRVVSKRQIHFLETEGGEVCGYLAAARELA